jgi:hypothetical protein
VSDDLFLSRFLPLIFLGCGLGLLGAAARILRGTGAFLRRAVSATGEVVSLQTVPPTDAQELPTYRPTVVFTVPPGQRVRFQSIAHSYPAEHAVGTKVPVLYDPERPQDARIASFTSLWLLPCILGGLGLTFASVGAAILLGWIVP